MDELMTTTFGPRAVWDGPEKETEGEKDKWMCSDNPGTGAIYTCKSMTCPVHGQRNVEEVR